MHFTFMNLICSKNEGTTMIIKKTKNKIYLKNNLINFFNLMNYDTPNILIKAENVIYFDLF